MVEKNNNQLLLEVNNYIKTFLGIEGSVVTSVKLYVKSINVIVENNNKILDFVYEREEKPTVRERYSFRKIIPIFVDNRWDPSVQGLYLDEITETTFKSKNILSVEFNKDSKIEILAQAKLLLRIIDNLNYFYLNTITLELSLLTIRVLMDPNTRACHGITDALHQDLRQRNIELMQLDREVKKFIKENSNIFDRMKLFWLSNEDIKFI